MSAKPKSELSGGTRFETGAARHSAAELKMVGDGRFAQEVLANERPVLVLFTAAGCLPCDLLARWLPPLSRELAGAVDFVRCAVESSPHAATAHRVEQTPTMTLFAGGAALASHTGLWPVPTIRRWIHFTLHEECGVCCHSRQGEREDRPARRFLRAFVSPSVRRRASRVASVVAPTLLLINHSELVFAKPFSMAVLKHLAMNFTVPYLVASYSATRAAAQSWPGAACLAPAAEATGALP